MSAFQDVPSNLYSCILLEGFYKFLVDPYYVWTTILVYDSGIGSRSVLVGRLVGRLSDENMISFEFF